MRHIMAVYDVDTSYAQRFAQVVNQKESCPFEATAFSSMERLKEYGKENRIELLLVSASVGREEAEQAGADRVIYLTEDGSSESGDVSGIYKYQSSENIVREAMACYCEDHAVQVSARLKGASILGVFSPVGRCLKTSFAITLGKLLAQESRTLYTNLEEYSGLSILTKTEYRMDLSDLLYFYMGGNYNVLRLGSVVHSMGSLDYIPPIRYPQELSQAGPDEIAGLLRAIAQESPYENVVVDVGSAGRAALPVLELCSVIYMPGKEDRISRAKLEEFDGYLEESGNREIKRRIQKMKLPNLGAAGRREPYFEQLLWGDLGDYVRQLLRGGIKQ